jgi:hypothetical protein
VSTNDEHPPLDSDDRIPRGQYDELFLATLHANGQVRSVDAHWSGDTAGFPAHVTHVLYPNGDLRRIGMA